MCVQSHTVPGDVAEKNPVPLIAPPILLITSPFGMFPVSIHTARPNSFTISLIMIGFQLYIPAWFVISKCLGYLSYGKRLSARTLELTASRCFSSMYGAFTSRSYTTTLNRTRVHAYLSMRICAVSVSKQQASSRAVDKRGMHAHRETTDMLRQSCRCVCR